MWKLFVLLVLCLCIACIDAAPLEMEISQHSYEKPVKVTRKRTGTEVPLETANQYYWTLVMQAGTPRQTLYLQIDTGSTDTYVESEDCTANCISQYQYRGSQSSTFVRIMCDSPLCNEREPCFTNGECSFKTTYVDQSSVLGNVAQDQVQMGTFSAPGTFGTILQSTAGFNPGSGAYSGIMGASDYLGDWGQPTILANIIEAAQVPNTITFCLQSSGGRMFIGEDPADGTAPYIWTPYANPRYDVVWLDLMLDGERVGLDAATLNKQIAIFDTGASLFALPAAVYDAVIVKLQSFCTTRDLKGVCDLSVGDLTQGSSVAMTYQELLEFPTLTLTFYGAYLHIRPWAYLDSSEGLGSYRLGFIRSSVTLIGDNVLKHMRVIFDRQAKRVGMAPGSFCPAGSGDGVWLSQGPTPDPQPTYDPKG